MNSNKIIAVLFFFFILLGAAVGPATISALSKSDSDTAASKNIHFYKYPGGLGADGYDVISYFNDSKAVKGNEIYEEEWGGVLWRFISHKNRKQFFQDPQRYIPQYGGHCAYGVAQGYLVRGDPMAWSIRDDKLYLNYSQGIRTAWLANAQEFIRRSELSWPKLNR
ncbi:YHS domain protein [Candidatus Persebacteraceae bacterium Df01]|uniref:YHS domain protein n=1 Tax=Candidatus Doriopsillibacter californiensis TaxID=2970740 RepID=A0ABT7QL81_9GAMM|nr:YHS domain protein [Candidatus Persebacteraceae bacterium Df01]